MNKIKCISVIFALLIAVQCCAQEPSDKSLQISVEDAGNRSIAIATTFEDTSKIIKNPGNCPIEILRRIGRVIAKHWPNGNIPSKTGSIIFNEFVGSPNFIKAFPENKLSEVQQKACDDLIKQHSERFAKLRSEFNAASEAISISIAANIPEIQDNFKKLIEPGKNQNYPISDKESAKIKESVLPVIEVFKDFCGVLSLSEKGIFVRADTELDKGKINVILPQTNLTIGKYIDDEPLIVLAQTHGLEDSEESMKKLDSIPNMALVKQLVASAGLDFQKDILENYAQESIFYVNLTPTGEQLIPDLRWIVVVPRAEKLVNNLPKFQTLCMQAGIFITKEESPDPNIPVSRLNYFMFNKYGLYVSLLDKFCIVTSTKEGMTAAINHLKNALKDDNRTDNLKDCNLYFRVKTSDLNVQLQQFLQSPLIRDQGIPPITNLTFLNDMNNITAFAKLIDSKLKFIVDIPFFKKNEKQ